MMSVTVSFCCVTNNPKTWWFKILNLWFLHKHYIYDCSKSQLGCYGLSQAHSCKGCDFQVGTHSLVPLDWTHLHTWESSDHRVEEDVLNNQAVFSRVSHPSASPYFFTRGKQAPGLKEKTREEVEKCGHFSKQPATNLHISCGKIQAPITCEPSFDSQVII